MSVTILEDTRQQAGKHETKHAWFTDHNVTLYRSKLPFGDYAPVPPVAVDTKKDMEEICMDICGKEHRRFIDEVKSARDAGCKLYVLVENDVGIDGLEGVSGWTNPRVIYNPKCPQGPQLHKAMQTISERYGCTFLFCRPDQSAEIISKILGIEYEQST